MVVFLVWAGDGYGHDFMKGVFSTKEKAVVSLETEATEHWRCSECKGAGPTMWEWDETQYGFNCKVCGLFQGSGNWIDEEEVDSD